MSHMSGKPASPGNPPLPTTPPPPPPPPGGYSAARAELERLSESGRRLEERGEALERLARDVADAASALPDTTTPTERLTGLVMAFEQLCGSHVALWDGRIGSAAETHKRCVEGIGEVELALIREFMSVITGEGQ